MDRKGAKRGRAAAEREWSGDGSGSGFQETGALWPGGPLGRAQRGLHSIFALPRLLPSAGLDRLQLQAPDPSGQRTRVCGDGGRDAQAAPGRGPEHLFLLPGSSRTAGAPRFGSQRRSAAFATC